MLPCRYPVRQIDLRRDGRVVLLQVDAVKLERTFAARRSAANDRVSGHDAGIADAVVERQPAY